MAWMRLLRKRVRFRDEGRSVAADESGQAALVAVSLIPAAITRMPLVFNTGQLTANKLKVQTAADAAAQVYFCRLREIHSFPRSEAWTSGPISSAPLVDAPRGFDGRGAN